MKNKIITLCSMIGLLWVVAMPMQAQAAQTSGITTVAGGGSQTVDGVDALLSSLSQPSAVTTDSYGNIYISDLGHRKIRKVDYATGVITTIAGTGIAGNTGDGGPAILARIANVSSIDIAPNGDVYFADKFTHVIRKITVATGIISTVAGQAYFSGNTGDYGSGTLAKLNAPEDIAWNNAGTFLYVADTGNNRIRRIDVNGVIGPVSDATGVAGYAGDGSVVGFAKFNKPTKIAFDKNNNYYIVDSLNYRIRKVDSFATAVSTIAGTGVQVNPSTGDGADATLAGLNVLSGVAVDSYSNVYITDGNTLRKIDGTTGMITTVVGGVLPAGSLSLGDGQPSVLATLNAPSDIHIDANDNIFIADTSHYRVRKIFANTVPPAAVVFTSPVNNAVSQYPDGWVGIADPYSVVFLGLDGVSNTYDYVLTSGSGAWSGGHIYGYNTEGTHVLTAYAVDGAGNVGPTTSVSYTIDLTPPVITLVGDNPLTVIEGTYKDPGATATDSVDGDVTASVFTSGPNIYGTQNLQDGQTIVAGTVYNIMYTAFDSVGNTTSQADGTSLIREVHVIADPYATTSNGNGSSGAGGSNGGGDSGGGGGCIAPTVSGFALLSMLVLLLGGLAIRRKQQA